MSSIQRLLTLIFPAVVICYSSFTDVTKILKTATPAYSVYTGYQEVDMAQDIHAKCAMFFQYVTKDGETLKNISSKTPLLIWLNGGPGSSSQLGSWTEVGPWSLTSSGEVVERQHRWNKHAHLLFIDQPVTNVGLSFCRSTNFSVSNTSQASGHFVQFLERLFKQSELSVLKGNPIYLLGQSFGGHYAPYFANAIINSTLGLNLVSVALADGWVNPSIQMMRYDGIYSSAAIQSPSQKSNISSLQANAYQSILQKSYKQATTNFDVITDISPWLVSVYNFMQPQRKQAYAHQTWINANRQAYGVPNFVNFSQGNSDIYKAFAVDISTSYSEQVQLLLTRVKVMIYVGQYDLIVNVPTTMSMVNSLKWSGIPQWQKKDKIIWKEGGNTVGNVQTSNNLTLAVIYGAGHMVPTDQPVAAMRLLLNFINDKNDWNN